MKEAAVISHLDIIIADLIKLLQNVDTLVQDGYSLLLFRCRSNQCLTGYSLIRIKKIKFLKKFYLKILSLKIF